MPSVWGCGLEGVDLEAPLDVWILALAQPCTGWGPTGEPCDLYGTRFPGLQLGGGTGKEAPAPR